MHGHPSLRLSTARRRVVSMSARATIGYREDPTVNDAPSGPASPARELHRPSPEPTGLGEFTGQGISVIIPAYEDTPKLRRALWSIRQTADLPYELIVACAKQCVAKNR